MNKISAREYDGVRSDILSVSITEGVDSLYIDEEMLAVATRNEMKQIAAGVESLWQMFAELRRRTRK